jgi:quinoprotein glucose dehydrogenase
MKSNMTKITLGALSVAMMMTSSYALAQSAANRAPYVNWSSYNADIKGSRYLPLNQINASNFSQLEVAWRFKTDALGSRPEYKLEGTPLMVDGTIYATGGTRRSVVALDAVTGEMKWMHAEFEGARGAASPRQLSGRGLSYWTDGTEARILYVTPGYKLIALDAKTGYKVKDFGDNGEVDLKQDFDQEIRPNLTVGEVGLHAAPVVANNTIIIGAAFREGFTPATHNNTKGYVRAFDVRTGKRIWTFHTIPKKGQFGYDTWLNGSAEVNGNTGVWTQISVDTDLNMAYLPVESATSDFYGGKHLFANSLVAVDLTTGERKWHYQMIHHEIWDLDNSSQPMLMDVTVEGKPVKAVAITSKMNMLYVFDRATGKPVFPIPEVKVEKGNVPGEWYSPTQPMPRIKYARNSVEADQLIDFTPELNAKAKELVKDYKMGPLYTPPIVSTEKQLGTLNMWAGGGTNWPGSSFDPETGMVYVYANQAGTSSTGLLPPPPGLSDLPYVVGVYGTTPTMIRGPGDGVGADVPQTPPPPPAPNAAPPRRLTIDGLPLLKPPYSVISAIDVNTGTIKWSVPHGDTPDYVRNSPALQGLNIPRTGQPGYQIGTLVTKDLVIAGDGMVTTTPEHPRGAMLRAYNKQTGAEVGNVWMPAQQSGTPMTYSVNGKQYIVVAVGGGTYSGEYIAYTLPSAN